MMPDNSVLIHDRFIEWISKDFYRICNEIGSKVNVHFPKKPVIGYETLDIHPFLVEVIGGAIETDYGQSNNNFDFFQNREYTVKITIIETNMQLLNKKLEIAYDAIVKMARLDYTMNGDIEQMRMQGLLPSDIIGDEKSFTKTYNIGMVLRTYTQTTET
jgi:hypothetical protein